MDLLAVFLRQHLLRITCAQVSHRKDFLWVSVPGKAHCTVSGVVKVYTALRLKLLPCRSNASLQQTQLLSSGRLNRRRPGRGGAGAQWLTLSSGDDCFMGSLGNSGDVPGRLFLPEQSIPWLAVGQSTSAPTAGSGSSSDTEAAG